MDSQNKDINNNDPHTHYSLDCADISGAHSNLATQLTCVTEWIEGASLCSPTINSSIQWPTSQQNNKSVLLS